MIAKSIEKAILVEPAELIGGDLSLQRQSGADTQPADIYQLQDMQARGMITSFTLIAYNNSSIAYRANNTGSLSFAGTALGIESGKYPLAGH